MPHLKPARQLHTGIAAAIVRAREEMAAGRIDQAQRYLELAQAWLEVSKKDLDSMLARVNHCPALSARVESVAARGLELVQ